MLCDKNEKNVIIQWGYKQLKSLGDLTHKIIKSTPWSFVVKYASDSNVFYLKKVPDMLHYESRLINALKKDFSAPVPSIISFDTDMKCFIMTDSGEPMQSHLLSKNRFELIESISYALFDFQKSVSMSHSVLYEIGVPDFTIARLPSLYREMIEDVDYFITEGLTEKDLLLLNNILFKIESGFSDFHHFEMVDTLIQPDFNLENTVISKDGEISFVDLGESVISHPFFAIRNFLNKISRLYGCGYENESFINITKKILKPYSVYFESEDSCYKDFKRTFYLNQVYSLVYLYRFSKICGRSNLLSYNHWNLKQIIKDFINCTDDYL